MIEVEKIVDTLAQFNLLRTHKIANGWYQCYCPFHNNGQERRPSFGISLNDEFRGGVKYKAGFGHCFTCGFNGDIERIVTQLLKDRNINQSGKDWLIENVPGYESEDDDISLIPKDLMTNITNKFNIDYIQDKLGQHGWSYISEDELAKYRFTVPYMYERKLTDDVIEKYDIGYDGEWVPPGRVKKVPCITFPVSDSTGKVVFLCRRSIQGKLYNYPDGVTKPVYGLNNVVPGTESLIICESCINALTAVVYGYQAVALLGTGNSYQIQQLKTLGIREFVLCMDGDEAGRRATNRLKKALHSVALVWVVEMPEGKDLNDCTKEEFDKLYRERS